MNKLNTLVLAALTLVSAAQIARAAPACDAKLQKIGEAQAERDFPGTPLEVKATTPDEGLLGWGCVEVRTTAEPAKVLAVYDELVDEVCELNSGLNRLSDTPSCASVH